MLDETRHNFLAALAPGEDPERTVVVVDSYHMLDRGRPVRLQRSHTKLLGKGKVEREINGVAGTASLAEKSPLEGETVVIGAPAKEPCHPPLEILHPSPGPKPK